MNEYRNKYQDIQSVLWSIPVIILNNDQNNIIINNLEWYIYRNIHYKTFDQKNIFMIIVDEYKKFISGDMYTDFMICYEDMANIRIFKKCPKCSLWFIKKELTYKIFENSNVLI